MKRQQIIDCLERIHDASYVDSADFYGSDEEDDLEKLLVQAAKVNAMIARLNLHISAGEGD